MEETVLRLARYIDEKRYGKYRGFVSDNLDPEKRGRLRLFVPSVLGDQETDWALPCLPFGGHGKHGFFAVPEKDAQVWVEFEEGNVSRPVWTGTFWQQTQDVPPDAAIDKPTTRLLQTPAGHILQFDDAKDEERFRLYHPRKAEMVIDRNGTVSITDARGSRVTLDADGGETVIEDAGGNRMKMHSSGVTLEDSSGNRVEMTSSGISVKGRKIVVEGGTVELGGMGGEPVIKGSFLNMFNLHAHSVPGVGASGPPLPLAMPQILTSRTKAQ